MRRTMLKRGSLLLAGAGLACLVGACWVEPEPLPGGGGPDGGSGGTAGKAGSGGGGSAGAAGKGNTSGAGGYGASSGSGGSGGSGSACEGPNPAGCASNACPPNAVCDQTIGCLPSSCACGEDGLWTCTDDCGGGVCVPVGPECNDATAAIGAETVKFESCTAVVRLRYGSLTPIGWQLVCGDYGALTEGDARALAGEVTGFGAEGELVSGADPADEWVFWEAPGDFGGVGVISARSPFALFGGGVIWDGRGNITYPAEWRDPSELGFSCANGFPEGVPTRGFNLGSGMPLSEGEAQEALTAVYASALPMGLAVAQDVLDALVLFYPPTVGVLDPTVAEYVVFLNSGIFQF